MAILAGTVRWLRPWMAAVVAVLGLVTVVTAFAQDMPAVHHLAVPAAAVVMLAAWAIELSGLRWPRLLLVLGVVLPNIGLTLIQVPAGGGVSPCWCCIMAALRQGGQAACWPAGAVEAAPCSCGRPGPEAVSGRPAVRSCTSG